MKHNGSWFGVLALGVAVATGCGSDKFEGMTESPGTGGMMADGGMEDGDSGGAGNWGGMAGKGGASGEAGTAGATGGGAGEAGGGTAGQAGEAGSGAVAGASGEGGLGGMGGADAGPDAPICPDPLHEPNETEATAASLPSVDVCDTKTTGGIAAFDTDVDWYQFEGKYSLLSSCNPTPSASVDVPDLRVCVFTQCKSGTTSVVCTQGLAATSPSGRQGCCASGSAVELKPSCSGTNKDATVYVRIDQPESNVCTAYQLQYGF